MLGHLNSLQGTTIFVWYGFRLLTRSPGTHLRLCAVEHLTFTSSCQSHDDIKQRPYG